MVILKEIGQKHIHQYHINAAPVPSYTKGQILILRLKCCTSTALLV